MRILLIFCGLIWAQLSLSQPLSRELDRELFIPVEGSELYVRLLGNADGPIILNLHGGPGAFSGFDHEKNRFYLENDYLVAYLDQRGGGKSAPDSDSSRYTMRQFVADLDVVVDSLYSLFPNRPINLLGSSWGGTLGLLYMIEHQDKIQSFACVSGKADGVYPIQALIDHEQALALKKLSQAENRADSLLFQGILTDLDSMEKADWADFYQQVNLLKHDFAHALGFDVYWANQAALKEAQSLGEDPEYYQRAHYTKDDFDKAMQRFDFINGVFRSDSLYNNLNIMDQIAIITRPVLLMQGAEDFSIGQKQAEMMYAALTGVPKADKFIHIIPVAAHNLNFEASEDYFQELKRFFSRYNF